MVGPPATMRIDTMPNQHTYKAIHAEGRAYAEAGGVFSRFIAEQRYPDNPRARVEFIAGCVAAHDLANGTTLAQRVDAYCDGNEYADAGGRDYGHESHRRFPGNNASDCELRHHFRLGYHYGLEGVAKQRREADAMRKRNREAQARQQGATLHAQGCTRDASTQIGEGLNVGSRLHRVIDAAWCEAAREAGDAPMPFDKFWIHAFA